MPIPANTLIQTKRLKLVPVSSAYAEVIFREFTPAITTYMFPAAPKTITDTNDFIATSQKLIESDEVFNVTILRAATEEFIGGAGISDTNTKTPELGIWVKQSAHGHKYGQEAVHALKSWADSHLTYDHLRYPVDRKNTPSRKIAETLGGVVRTEYNEQTHDGRSVDMVEYWIQK